MKRNLFLLALTAIWGYAVFQYGGVVTWDRKVFLLALGAVGLGYRAMHRESSVPLPAVLRWSACLLPLYVACQLVPLPAWLLGALSPGREEVLRAFQKLAPGERFATLSVVPGITMNHLLLVCGYGLIFLLVYELAVGSGDRRWVMIFPPLAIVGLEALLGIVQMLGDQEASGTYVNRDHYSALLEMTLPFAVAYPLAIWRGIDTRKKFPAGPALRMCFFLAVAAVMLVGILSSLSRMGFVAALFSVLVMGMVTWRGSGRRSVAVVVVLGLGLAGAFVLLPSDQLITRFAQMSSTDQITAEGRLLLWGESLKVLRVFPVFGCGLGGYESAFLRYKVSVPMVRDNYAHNDYLQLLIELGAVGFAIGAVLFGGIVARTWRAASRRYEPQTRFPAIGCIGAFAAIGLHSFVDFNLYTPANAMLLAWIAGVGVSLAAGREQVHDVSSAGVPMTIDLVPESPGHFRWLGLGRGRDR